MLACINLAWVLHQTYTFISDIHKLSVVTSALQRTISTAAYIKGSVRSSPLLNEIDAGLYEGLTYSEFKITHPKHYNQRERDKLRFKYPEGETTITNYSSPALSYSCDRPTVGESYVDCYNRVTPIMSDIEASGDGDGGDGSTLLVVSHQAILRCLVGRLIRADLNEIPFIAIPQHELIRVTWSSREGKDRIDVDHIKIDLGDTD